MFVGAAPRGRPRAETMRCQVVYTDRQRELIRARVKEYYDLHHFGARKISWAGLCDEIFDDTRKHVRSEPLRQWVTGFVAKDRNQPLRRRPEEMEPIIEFLMLPDIAMLSPEELEDPEPPYRFLRSFQEFLRINSSRHIPESPSWLGGLYEAWHQVDDAEQLEEIWVKTTLRLDVDWRNRHVHATETWEMHVRSPGETSVLSGGLLNEGWGVVTPEGNLFLFMKTKPYDHNYYYLSLAARRPQLAMLRHEFPADSDPAAKTFEELIKATRQHTLILCFDKVNEDQGE
jgi:hypothetical protein